MRGTFVRDRLGWLVGWAYFLALAIDHRVRHLPFLPSLNAAERAQQVLLAVLGIAAWRYCVCQSSMVEPSTCADLPTGDENGGPH